MKKTGLAENDFFTVSMDKDRIAYLTPKNKTTILPDQLTDRLASFAELVNELLLSEDQIQGIIYGCPLFSTGDYYKTLLQEAKQPGFEVRLSNILKKVTSLTQSETPVVSIIDESLNAIQSAPALWGHHTIITQKGSIKMEECGVGLFPGFGATVMAAKKLHPADAFKLLIKGGTFNAEQAMKTGLSQALAKDRHEAATKAKEWILSGHKINHSTPKPEADKLEERLASLEPLKKKVNLKIPGILFCLQLITASQKLPIEESLELETMHYSTALKNPYAIAILRTLYYGVNANKESQATSTEKPIQKIGVIGAGMMGSGIAFEVAKAGIQAILKDTSLPLAEKGKQYTEKCCDKLIALGRMTPEKKQKMLSLILPTEDLNDLYNSDIIIEAVFEQLTLKSEVIKSTEPYLKENGIFASNTTSLPISELATFSHHPRQFIGMHFFSPVDRMPLVEIILGKQTSESTLTRAKTLALLLGKIPIVVHDSPAFFTSRIFFNYLLEGITMLLEGIPADTIESQAIQAGFAVSPLAVLDEISLPLMVHVYDQLPKLSGSQIRCREYLKKLIAQNRTGRKAGKGFYSYDPEKGKKLIMEDLPGALEGPAIDHLAIQKRFLHIMALDTFRCLDEGVLDRPVDGDIGSILGVGYAAHTGGAISHIDQTGIQTFVSDCLSFKDYGEQWEVPATLKDLAAQGFRFYTDLTSNWKV